MTESEKISKLPPERTSQHYAALREISLELIGNLAAKTWTDHNVHDPGITFAEAYIYALTDVAFRTQLPMRDLLRSGEKIAAPALPEAHRVLPCAPVTSGDLRKVLLDHYLIKDAAISATSSNVIPFYRDDSLSPPLTYSAGGERIRLQGLYEVLIEFQTAEQNSNSYGLTVDYNGNTYSLDLALPHWDEAESAVFHEEVTIDTVTLLNEGDARGIVEFSDTPNPTYSTVPTAASENLSLRMGSFIVVATPAGVPDDIVGKIETAYKNALESDEFQTWVADVGVTPNWLGADEVTEWAGVTQASIFEQLDSLVADGVITK